MRVGFSSLATLSLHSSSEEVPQLFLCSTSEEDQQQTTGALIGTLAPFSSLSIPSHAPALSRLLTAHHG